MPGRASAFLEGIREYWKTLPPQAKASYGASIGILAAGAAAIPASFAFNRQSDKGVKHYKETVPTPIGQAKTPLLILNMIKKFKAEHPETKAVPVFVSGKISTSQYISAANLAMPGARSAFKDIYGITKPGVYIKDKDAATVLHELGHASGIASRIPITVYSHYLAPKMALPLLAWTILKKPGKMEHLAPLIALGLQAPRLAEEARASIVAHKTLKRQGIDSNRLLPAWGSYLAASTIFPAATLGAVIAKRI